MRRFPVRLAVLLSGTALGGCVLPEYHLPGGYSSTAHRRRSESQIDWPQPVRDGSHQRSSHTAEAAWFPFPPDVMPGQPDWH